MIILRSVYITIVLFDFQIIFRGLSMLEERQGCDLADRHGGLLLPLLP